MSVRLKRVRDQVIVVTGASSGIGLTTAETAAERGARVVLNSRDQAQLEQIAERIRARGGRAIAAAGDVADAEAMELVARRRNPATSSSQAAASAWPAPPSICGSGQATRRSCRASATPRARDDVRPAGRNPALEPWHTQQAVEDARLSMADRWEGLQQEARERLRNGQNDRGDHQWTVRTT